MTKVDRHNPGSFCWIELNSTDQNAAKKFYGDIFGWKANDSPIGPGQFYTMFEIDGLPAAAGYTIGPEERAQGVPTHWGIYIEVENADDSAAKVTKLGGKLLKTPFDAMEYGRMAVAQDPTGAVFQIWQSKATSGIKIAGVHGTLCWADLSTPDPKKAMDFYSGLFGWKFVADKDGLAGYHHIENGSQMIGGVPPTAHRKPGTPPHWLAYFLVDDVDATAAKAKAGGAQFYLAPMTMEGVGRMSVMADPQGAAFAIFKSAR